MPKNHLVLMFVSLILLLHHAWQRPQQVSSATLYVASSALFSGFSTEGVATEASALVSKNGGEPAVNFDAIPQNFQVTPRNTDTNMATLSILGSVEEPGQLMIIARLFQGESGATGAGQCNEANEGSAYQVRSQALTYSSNRAPFTLSLSLEAALINYQLEICLQNGGGATLVREITDLAAGDIFLIQGQSNANAEIRPDSSSANGNQSDFVRSFGYRETSFNPDTDSSTSVRNIQNNAQWFRAEGDARNGPGAVGQWGLRLGRKIVDEIGVPVGIINNAVSSTTIEQHQRDDTNPARLSGFRSGGIYGRLLWRAQRANVAQYARAMIWHQGESDAGNSVAYSDNFQALYDDWMTDYPGLEKVYIHQIRNVEGLCGSHDPLLREAQRLLVDDPTMPLISLMSTTGIDTQVDGCHFPYTDGYQIMGDNLFRLMARDLYEDLNAQSDEITDITDVEAPNVDYAYFSNANRQQVTLVMRAQGDTLSWNRGADTSNGPEDDFGFSQAGVEVDSGSTAGHMVRLNLNQAAAQGTTIHYFGHPGVNPPTNDVRAGDWIVNANGVGMLAFFNVPIAVDIPTVQRLAPAEPVTTFRQTPVEISYRATDLDGIDTIQIWVGAELIYEKSEAELKTEVMEQTSWLPTALGEQPLVVQALDRRGASARSSSILVDVTNRVPTVSVLSPQAGTTFVLGEETILLSAEPIDMDGRIATVSFWVDENALTTLSAPPWELEWTDPSVGQHNFYVQATDNDGGVSTSSTVPFELLSPTPTSTASPSPMATATATNTPTPTSTSTATVPPTAMPTSTLEPSETPTVVPSPTATLVPAALQIVPTLGAPGSHFVLSGTGFTPSDQEAIYVNQSQVGIISVESTGSFRVSLVTNFGTVSGSYLVQVGNEQITYQVDTAAERIGPQGQLIEILVPRLGEEGSIIFLPLLSQ
ncbi:MAG: sialate O-acetylesterase [Chloroflexota bacterium]